MNIEDMTIGQARELASLFGANQGGAIGRELIGKYVIVRSRNEGINAGVLKEMDETGVILTSARRIWYHKPSDKKLAWYEGVAITGLSSDSKVSATIEVKAIIEDYSLTLCASAGEASIREHKAHEQN